MQIFIHESGLILAAVAAPVRGRSIGMGVTLSRGLGRRYRRGRRLARSQRAVVAVVGTLLALLVFFALFGIFLTQYLPLWMTDNEAQFTAQADLAFATFKQNVDSQYQFPGASPQSLGTPFQVSSQGIPLLAQPTQGTLVFLPSTCPAGFVLQPSQGALGQPKNPQGCVFANITLSNGPGGSGFFSQRIATGTLEMLLPNRYYTPETFYFEDDGVVQSQNGGFQTMAINPPFNVTKVAGGNTTVTTSMLQLYGNASTFIGQGSQDVYSHFRYSQFVTANGLLVPSNGTHLPYVFTFEIGTQFPCAWSTFLNQTMLVSGVARSSYTFTPFTGNCANPLGLTTVLTLTISNVNYSQFIYAGDQVSLGIGGT
jgi:hypothetical protein